MEGLQVIDHHMLTWIAKVQQRLQKFNQLMTWLQWMQVKGTHSTEGNRPGVPKKLQSDLAERSRRSVPKIQKGWEQARWLEGLIVQIGQWITWKSWIANKGINFLTEAHSEQIPNGQNIQQRSVTAARRIEMHCDFLNSFSDETVGRFLKKYCRWDEDQVQHQKEKLKTFQM